MSEITIKLPKSGKEVNLNPVFFNATDGSKADYHTLVAMSYTADHLVVEFDCDQNLYTSYNKYLVNNEPLYEQEVFEIFISGGKKTPTTYVEIEINPNNALWVGIMDNPTLIEPAIRTMVTDSKIIHSVKIYETKWTGKLEIPWTLIPLSDKKEYRFNLYRIRAKTLPTSKDWVCNDQNADFICLSSTLSGASAAFHRPQRFASLKIV